MGIEKLTKAIEEAVEAKTFSLEAVGVINKLRESAEELKAELALKDKQIAELRRDIDTAADYQQCLEKKLEAAEKELKELRALKDQMITWQLTARYESLRRDDIFQLVQTIFKSPVVRQSISECGQAPILGQYGPTTVGVSSNKTIETKED